MSDQRHDEPIDLDDDNARWATEDEAGCETWSAPQVGDDARLLLSPEHALFARTNEFIASTGVEGRDGDIIEQSSWRLGHYRKNPIVLDSHNPRADIGRAVRVRYVAEVDQLRAAIEWDLDDPMAARIAGKHQRGMRSAVSVRWRTGKRTLRNELPEDHVAYQKPKKREGFWGTFEHAGYFLQRCTLLEISSVTVPGDPRALQLRAERQVDVIEQIPDAGMRAELVAYLRTLGQGDAPADDPFINEIRRLVLGCVRSDPEIRRAILAHSLSAAREPEHPSPWAHLFPGAS